MPTGRLHEEHSEILYYLCNFSVNLKLFQNTFANILKSSGGGKAAGTEGAAGARRDRDAAGGLWAPCLRSALPLRATPGTARMQPSTCRPLREALKPHRLQLEGKIRCLTIKV